MANVLIEESTLFSVADAIRKKSGKSDLMKPAEMPAEIEALPSGGGSGVVLRITFDGNFEGQEYTVAGGSESYTGTIPAEKVVEVTVEPETETEYTVTATAVGHEQESRAKLTVQPYIYTASLSEPKPFEIVSWAEGTDEQIVALLAAAEEGAVDLVEDCGWKVGDVREVQLSAMDATGVGESHVAQKVKFVLSHAGATNGISRVDGGKIHFQVDQVDSLNELGYVNSSGTNAGSWDGCARRKWCNDVYYNAIPETLRPIFKQMNVTTAKENSSQENVESDDFFALRAEAEIFDTHFWSNQTEFDALEQVEWYKDTANRKKNQVESASYWRERSPRSDNTSNFCNVGPDGKAYHGNASLAIGLAPFGCI